MPTFAPETPRRAAFSQLKAALAVGHREASEAAFVPTGERLIRAELGDLDAALGGGFPRGCIATVEGAPGSGRSSVAARLLAAATRQGLGAVIERPHGPEGALYPPSLEAAGVRIERLFIVHADDDAGVARAADIVLRSGTCSVVVIPALRLSAALWTRLASLAHRADALLVALGNATAELRYFASLRLELQLSGVHWAKGSGLFGTLASIETQAVVLKHKRAVPGKIATFSCASFEPHGAPLLATAAYTLSSTSHEIRLARSARATSY